jgi:hypothetical protein
MYLIFSSESKPKHFIFLLSANEKKKFARAKIVKSHFMNKLTPLIRYVIHILQKKI